LVVVRIAEEFLHEVGTNEAGGTEDYSFFHK
jgi:hypothetical protein